MAVTNIKSITIPGSNLTVDLKEFAKLEDITDSYNALNKNILAVQKELLSSISDNKSEIMDLIDILWPEDKKIYYDTYSRKILSITWDDGLIISNHHNSLKYGNYILYDPEIYINFKAFTNTEDLRYIEIPEGVKYIDSGAFYNSGLEEILLPESMEVIGEYCFGNCNNLPVIDSIKYADTYLVEVVDKTLDSYTISENTKWINAKAFSDCDNLLHITIPEKVINIGSSAFQNCENLTNVIMPNNIDVIKNYTFQNCSSLTSVTIPDSVTSIGKGAFQNCSSLTSIIIPNNVTSIDEYAFASCWGLTSITIPNSTTSIGKYAFDGCDKLTAITIPNSVTSIGSGAFRGNNISTITYIGTIEQWNEKQWHPGSLSYSYILYMSNDLITSINIPEGTTAIKSLAFSGCTSLTSVSIPNSVTDIEYGAFSGCRNLTSVTIPDGVKYIRGLAFLGCNLTSVTIPKSVVNVGLENGAFNGNSLETLIIDSDNLLRFDRSYSSDLASRFSSVENCIIGPNVTKIGKYVFKSCHFLNNNITIGDNVKSIGENAFDDCYNIYHVIIGNSVGTINYCAFSYCSKLQSVTIPASVTTIGKLAFQSCVKLSSITYTGTISQWGAINKELYWNRGVPATVVHCSDGDVTLK